MRFKCTFLLLLSSLLASSGCATIRTQERQDPGHGGFDAILIYVSLGIQTAVAIPITATSWVVREINGDIVNRTIQNEIDEQAREEEREEEALQEKYRIAYEKAARPPRGHLDKRKPL